MFRRFQIWAQPWHLQLQSPWKSPKTSCYFNPSMGNSMIFEPWSIMIHHDPYPHDIYIYIYIRHIHGTTPFSPWLSDITLSICVSILFFLAWAQYKLDVPLLMERAASLNADDALEIYDSKDIHGVQLQHLLSWTAFASRIPTGFEHKTPEQLVLAFRDQLPFIFSPRPDLAT